MPQSIVQEILEIFITAEFEGFHSWDKAPDEVSFLRNKHRHLFKVKVWFPVNHNDRELEFFIMQRKLKYFILMEIDKDNVGSCEMACQKIAKMDSRIKKVEVSEDGENGATLTINYID